MIVVRRLWVVVGCGPMDIDRGSDNCGFDFGLRVMGHGLMVQWSWVVAAMVR